MRYTQYSQKLLCAIFDISQTGKSFGRAAEKDATELGSPAI